MAIIETSPRALFAQWIARALGQTHLEPSPMATAYLVELLDERVRVAPSAQPRESLAECLLAARLVAGPERIRGMRDVGDRALFVAGFFADSLSRAAVDVDYYREIGQTAYADVAGALALERTGPWPHLYAELAAGFGAFADVLAEVGERSRASRPDDLLRLYERYLRTGSPRDKQRLLGQGHLLPERDATRWWQ